MAKLYKTYGTAHRFAQTAIESVTLDGIDGFMERQSVTGCAELAHDTASWKHGTRHMVVIGLPSGLFGAHWYDESTGTAVGGLHGPAHRRHSQTLFTTIKAALDAHAQIMASYRANPVWQA